VRWAFQLKKIPYEYIPINLLKAEHLAPEHLARNPAGAIPVIELSDGRFMSESLAILEWSEERFPGTHKLYPGSPEERAHIRRLCEIINSGIQPLQTPRVTKALPEDPEFRKAWLKRFISEGLKSFEGVSRATRGAYCVGDSPTAADMCLVPQIYAAQRFDVEAPASLRDIYERALKTPEGLAASPDQQIDRPDA
jgi:maleylacetoacetate isomerase